MSCALEKNKVKERLMKKHTLVAVMSMPDDLFYPVGVVPCIMVFKAHVPHNPNIETWFGYWKDDGHIKLKKEGRSDYYADHPDSTRQCWAEIKTKWVDMFLNQKEIPGISVKHKVMANDEWCVEAYVDTDYSTLKQDDFIEELKKYSVFKIVGNKCN